MSMISFTTLADIIEAAYREGYEQGWEHRATWSSDHPHDRVLHENCNADDAWKQSNAKRKMEQTA